MWECQADVRYRVTTVLRYHSQTLRLPHYVEAHAKDDEIHVRGTGPIVRKFHLHISRLESLYAGRASVQASIHPRVSGTYDLPLSYVALSMVDRCHGIPLRRRLPHLRAH